VYQALSILLPLAVAVGDSTVARPPSHPQQGSLASPVLPADSASSPARAAYREAFRLMAERRWTEAATGFREVVATFPGSEEAVLAAEMLRLAGELTLREPVLGRPARATLDRSGRAELAVNATLFGSWAGIAVSSIAELGQASLLATSGTTALALATSLYLTRQGRITPGGASLVGTGIMVGTLDGALLALLADLDTKPALALTLVSGGAGLVAAAAIARAADVTSGGAALTTAGGYLGTFLAGMALVAFDVSGREAVAGTLLAGANLGILGGALRASAVEVSRGRVLFCELGGLLGGLTAGGVILAADRHPGGPAVAAALTVGVLAGAGLGIHLTSDYDAQRRDEAPTAVTLRLPAPLLIPAAGMRPPALGIGLLQGAF
jgi:hypothetical protein